MDVVPSRLAELHGGKGSTPWLMMLVKPEIGGGRLTASDLDTVDVPQAATALRVSGLDQTSFEALISRWGTRFSAIEFWKCPRVADLSPLEDLPQLRLVSFYWNQRATRLWDLRKTPQLTGLHLYNFTRLHDLSDLAAATSLIELEVGDSVWDTSVFDSLEPLSRLTNLRSLTLSAKKITDGRVEPLAALQKLTSLTFSAKQFTTEQVAWLRAHLPASLQSEALEPLRRFSPPLQGSSKPVDALLVGRRKPFLNSVDDHARIATHIERFEALVAQFRANPSLPPEHGLVKPPPAEPDLAG